MRRDVLPRRTCEAFWSVEQTFAKLTSDMVMKTDGCGGLSVRRSAFDGQVCFRCLRSVAIEAEAMPNSIVRVRRDDCLEC
jgi:hypothetical protein